MAKRLRHDPSTHNWEDTLKTAINAIVCIRFSQVTAFDTEGPTTSEATGFIVDANRGIILTNRHVVCSGPFVGEAVWFNHEETEVYPIYRDPVHDFGFLRFSPSSLKYMKVSEIELAPEMAKVGLDIRVVGNDAGEKLSILAGSISRIDRNVPDYGDLAYNDFNTFYLQAASSTSGGSSGSPVLNLDGQAVALQSGGHVKAATDFYLPLDRVKVALKYIQNGQIVPRGTIQTAFVFRPFEELRRLGLADRIEETVRSLNSEEIGMLCVETVIPEGPASSFLEEGDILVSVNDVMLTRFVPLAEILDGNIGNRIKFRVDRGGASLNFDIAVQNLHSITPDRYLMFGGAILNDLSYNLARQYCVPLQGVYVADPSGILKLDNSTDHGWIIDSINMKKTPNLKALIEVVKEIPDYERVPISFYNITDVHSKTLSITYIDRHWHSFKLAIRNDNTGFWDFEEFGPPRPAKKIEPITAIFPVLDGSLGDARRIFHSLAKVSMIFPAGIEGYPKSRKNGSGLVIDAEKGLIIVGRGIIPHSFGDITIQFADSIVIPAALEFLHPTQNIAIIKYDPKLIGNTAVETAKMSSLDITQGRKICLAAFNRNNRPVCINTIVTDVAHVVIPPNSTPRFRAVNYEVATLDTPIAAQCSSGVLTDSEGKVQGLWLSFMGEENSSGHDNEYYMGFDIREIVANLLPSLRMSQDVNLYGLPVEFTAIHIVQCRNMGLTESWARRIEEEGPSHRQLLVVSRLEAETEQPFLKEHDVLLALNGKVLSRISELDATIDKSKLYQLTILRENRVIELSISAKMMEGNTTKHLVFWAGAIFQGHSSNLEPHRAVRLQSKSIPSMVYVTSRAKGSPASMHGLIPTMWITHVNEVPTLNLSQFAQVIRRYSDKKYIRLKTISFDNIPSLVTVKVENHYFPLREMFYKNGQWS